jgi:hypothetical protein
VPQLEIDPAEIKSGDVLVPSDPSLGWVALEDARLEKDESIYCTVQLSGWDRSVSVRQWKADTSVRLQVERA